MKKNRAITLIELMVAMFLAGIVTLLFLSLFQLMRPAMSQAEFSYLLSADVEERLDQLRNELSDTALGAVSVTPASSGNPSGFSFPSFRDSKGAPVLDESGSPIWQQQVYVYLDPAGKVVSWQEPHITKVPVPASRASFPATGPTHVLLNDAVKPNAELTGLPVLAATSHQRAEACSFSFYDGSTMAMGCISWLPVMSARLALALEVRPDWIAAVIPVCCN